jgi:hypothetical protein
MYDRQARHMSWKTLDRSFQKPGLRETQRKSLRGLPSVRNFPTTAEQGICTAGRNGGGHFVKDGPQRHRVWA